MQKTFIVTIVVVVLLSLAFIVTRSQSQVSEVSTAQPEETAKATMSYEPYQNADLGLAFSYLKGGQSGYTLYEPVRQGENVLKTLMLVHANELSMMENPPVGGEGPIAITIAVYANDAKQFPYAWAEKHAAESNITLALGEIKESVIGGANAIRYRADGLYTSEVAVVAHGTKMYLFTVTYLDQTSPTLRDFEPLLKSVTFIPEPGQQ